MEVKVTGIDSPATSRRVEVFWRATSGFVPSLTHVVVVRLNDEQEWLITVSNSTGSSLLFDATGWQSVVKPSVTVIGCEEVPLEYAGLQTAARKIKIEAGRVGTASLEEILEAFGPSIHENYSRNVTAAYSRASVQPRPSVVSSARVSSVRANSTEPVAPAPAAAPAAPAAATSVGGNGINRDGREESPEGGGIFSRIGRMITSFVSWLMPAAAPAEPPPPPRPRPQPLFQPQPQPVRRVVSAPAARRVSAPAKPCWKPSVPVNFNSIDNNSNDNEPNLIRLDHNMFHRLTVRCNLDESTSRLTATISWTIQGHVTPDNWQVRVVNRTWSQGDNCKYHQWLFVVDKGCKSFKLPLRLRPGNRYAVTVRGLKCANLPFGVKELHSVVCRGSVEGRAGPVLSIDDVGKLHSAAVNYVHEKGGQSTDCRWLYRTKSKQYFDRIINDNDGKMSTHLKDSSGDLRSPINGEISGLFFAANAQLDGQPFPNSPFGDTRLLVEAREMLNITSNVYFADFYCLVSGGPHYVILVLTRPDSAADRFCRQHLPQLSLDDRHTNPFLFVQNGRLHVTNFSCHVEVFYTEEIGDIRKHQMVGNVGLIKSGSSKQGGVPKTRDCRACNLFHGLPLMIDQCPSDYDKF